VVKIGLVLVAWETGSTKVWLAKEGTVCWSEERREGEIQEMGLEVMVWQLEILSKKEEKSWMTEPRERRVGSDVCKYIIN
jgi:hypothetical protein